MPWEENVMLINKIIAVKREKKKGHRSEKGAVVGALSTVYMSLNMPERDRSRSLYNVA